MFVVFFLVIVAFGFLTRSFYTDFLKSIYYCIRFPQKQRLYGILLWLGLPGEGKSLSMTSYIDSILENCEKNNKEYEVYTNYFYYKETAPLMKWEDLIEIAENKKGREHVTTLIAIDEINTVFNSRDWSNFPIEVMTMIAQSRHMNIQFLCTAQCWTHVEKTFRDLTNWVYKCKRVNSYYYVSFKYDAYDYENNKVNRLAVRFNHLLASKELFSHYDSYAYVSNLKKTKFQERKQIEDSNVLKLDKAILNKIKI